MGRRTWSVRDLALLLVLGALSVVASFDIWRDIFGMAMKSDEQSHIFLAPVIAAWLVWVRRSRLRHCRPGWSFAGPAVIVAGWFGAWFGFTSSIDIAWHGGAVLMLIGSILTVVGTDVFRKFLPAFLVMAFLLPVPGRVRHAIAVRLQEVSADIAFFLLDLFGLPIEQSGNVLLIQGAEVAVAEACNGMRMVAAVGLVSFAFVFSVPMRTSVRLTILFLSPLVALVVNVIRLLPTVLMYGYAGEGLADLFHDVSGWVMLFVALGVLWGLLSLMRWIEIPITPYAAGEEV